MRIISKSTLVALIFLALGLVLFFSPPASSGMEQESPSPSPSALPSAPPSATPQGEVTDTKGLLSAMEKTVASVADYSFIGYIRLDKGTLVADYRCVRPSTIRAEVLEGNGKGAVILYLPEQKKGEVKVKMGGFRVWRSIERLKLQNTPIVESLVDMILNMMRSGKDVAFKGAVDLFAQVDGSIAVSLNGQGAGTPVAAGTPTPEPSPSLAPSLTPSPEPSPLENPPSPTASPSDASPASPTPAPTPSAGGGKTIAKKCYLVEIRKDEFTDTIAIDAETFWPAYAKRIKGDQLVFEAVITEMKLNSSPRMEF
ncbi:MAG: hypothetical protein RDV48_18150 [Candidatus Eremiobacteraeota bacterium]|nr:hypothetical protein [Candidatus Eremiobacteraeota bacterium]